MDLINKNRVIKKIHREINEQENNAIPGEDVNTGVIVGLKMAAQIIKEQPAAEKTGKWIEHDCWADCYYECSVCGAEYMLDNGTPADNHYHYCPNCGAKMEEQQ